jgi:hypothetical protein
MSDMENGAFQNWGTTGRSKKSSPASTAHKQAAFARLLQFRRQFLRLRRTPLPSRNNNFHCSIETRTPQANHAPQAGPHGSGSAGP